jgi:hypothetical protein
MDEPADMSSENLPGWHLLDGCAATRNRKGDRLGWVATLWSRRCAKITLGPDYAEMGNRESIRYVALLQVDGKSSLGKFLVKTEAEKWLLIGYG